MSKEFDMFLKGNGIQQMIGTSYNVAMIGLAERVVQTSAAMKKSLNTFI